MEEMIVPVLEPTTATGGRIVPIVPTSDRIALEPPMDTSFHFSLFTARVTWLLIF